MTGPRSPLRIVGVLAGVALAVNLVMGLVTESLPRDVIVRGAVHQLGAMLERVDGLLPVRTTD